MAAPIPGTSAWIAPGVIISLAGASISLAGTTFNLIWNVRQAKKAREQRAVDHERAEYSRRVALPLEAAIGGLERFVSSVRAAKSRFASQQAGGEAFHLQGPADRCVRARSGCVQDRVGPGGAPGASRKGPLVRPRG